jgi:hypothetical protein
MFQSDRGLRIARWAAGFWAALIFVLSSISSAGSGGGVTLRGAVLHIGEYAVLAGLLRLGGLSRAATIVFATLYGLSDEFHQAFVPGRDASFVDAGFDLVASAVAAVIARPFRGPG